MMLVSPKKSFNSPQTRSPALPLSPLQEDSGGRFIPNRVSSSLVNTFDRCEDTESPQKTDRPESHRRFSGLLRSQLFGGDITNSDNCVYRYKPQPQGSPWTNKENIQLIPSAHEISVTALPTDSRSLPKTPFKVLDAPELPDDFYLSLLDWSAKGLVAVGLHSTVYLWSAETEMVVEQVDLQGDSVCSVAWDRRGDTLAVGGRQGLVRIFDVNKGRIVRVMDGHRSRAGVLAWSDSILSSGSKDKSILQRDLRLRDDFASRFCSHRQEVCGLKWSPDSQQLASGGNDNKVFTWTLHSAVPQNRFELHSAAVKAVAWSPHQRGILASGGGTADRSLRLWNSLLGTQVAAIDTGSQICGVIFSRNSEEVVSTHGYSRHQVSVWKNTSLQKVGDLMGHTSRVLYLALSPDGQNLVTGAGDETLRFWNAFPASSPADRRSKFALSFRELR